MWTALFACCLIGRKQSFAQAVGILLVMMGLCLPALDGGEDAPQGQIVFVGIVVTIAATLFYAAEYVWAERCFAVHKIDGTHASTRLRMH